MTPVPRVLLSVTLTGPTPSDGADASRLCRGRFHPSWHLPGQAAPSYLTPAASGTRAKVSHLHSNHSASWRTAVFTDNPMPLLDTETCHRQHAIVEQVIADLKSGPLAHLPSAKLNANAAWLVLAAIAFNLTRAAGCLASTFHARATGATIRRHLITVPARLARSARRVTLHLPTDWPWADDWMQLFDALHAPTQAGSDQPPAAREGLTRTSTWNSRTDRPLSHTHPAPPADEDQHVRRKRSQPFTRCIQAESTEGAP
jgi:hypothetical protein